MEPQIDFFDQFVLDALAAAGLKNLTDEQKRSFVPQIREQLEQYIGHRVLPLLDEKNQEMFVSLLQKEDTTKEEWFNFLKVSIPHFENNMVGILADFSKEVKQILQ
ncbi:MAG: hypothetical protein HN726_04285 [Candidatus Magasanikbacteria bacterium]|jgi:hypothetical protein|nr:hypothetical protein [Candidatus Magasanikbacteria bacterium]MBT4220844.1 hypothetical protein [Candidatus Magasanikbacteria bacterium]MBT4350189.1 hypothetical protein [Candidatus Magasanikbacteria bacterium]MBT4541368.1 hypothetical protein [Candidatus Magasanikbacteria bacterium]MBT4942047.1 hypothetical protein [Candidatus Magasanikbacteria bacterium]